VNTAFLDTIGLIATWDRSDQWHVAASAAYAALTARPVRLVTSTLVLFECGNASARRPYRRAPYDLWVALETADDLLHPTADRSGGLGRPTPRHPSAGPGSWITCRSF
jgi:hypothetical protein